MLDGGYSRWDDSDPLDHETRAAIHEFLDSTPGAYLSEIGAAVDASLSTTRYHLDVLADEGLVRTSKVRGKRRFYLAPGDDVQLIAAVRDDGTASVLSALARLGEASGGRLAEEVDRDDSTVSHHLSWLENAGLVERERKGRRVVNRVAPSVREELSAAASSPSERSRPKAE